MKKSSKIGAAITAVIDIVTAGLLWLLCSLPLVTLGASSAALYYCVVKCIRHERGRLVKSFFAAFRRDFKAATLLWLIFLAAALLLGADVYAFCGYLALRNIGTTLLMTIELLGFGLIVWLMPPLVFILPGLVCLLLSLHIEPVFKPLTAEMTTADGDDWFNE